MRKEGADKGAGGENFILSPSSPSFSHSKLSTG